jgi:hypothetical protein
MDTTAYRRLKLQLPYSYHTSITRKEDIATYQL